MARPSPALLSPAMAAAVPVPRTRETPYERPPTALRSPRLSSGPWPDDTWKRVMPRLRGESLRMHDALAHANTHGWKAFAFDLPRLGAGGSPKRFFAAPADDFYDAYVSVPHDQRHAYEVIEKPVWLFLDLESERSRGVGRMHACRHIQYSFSLITSELKRDSGILAHVSHVSHVSAPVDLDTCRHLGETVQMSHVSQVSAPVDLDTCRHLGETVQMSHVSQVSAPVDLDRCRHLGGGPHGNACDRHVGRGSPRCHWCRTKTGASRASRAFSP
jgi:hypothetical protein